MTSPAFFFSATDNWPTPQSFYDRLDDEFEFVLDVCASTSNHKAATFYALDHPDPGRRDGLAGNWTADAATGSVWMNPPYGRGIEAWMAKAHQTAGAGAVVVCLVPVRASSAWWHDLVLGTGAEVRYVRGRLTFGDAKTSAPFASAVVIYRRTDVPGAAGPVATITARAAQAAPVRLDDTAAEVSTYIAGFTPRKLDSSAWAVAALAVRDLVTRTKPTTVAQARLYLSALAQLLAHTEHWDRTTTPDWARLLHPAVIAAYIGALPASSARTRTTRRDTLRQLARAIGAADPVSAPLKGPSAPDPLLAAAADAPIGITALLEAHRQVTGRHRVDPLKPVIDALRTHAFRPPRGTAPSHCTSTVWASATFRLLSEVANQDPRGTVASNVEQAAKATGTKPMSRRAALAHARAKAAARRRAAEGPEEVQLPDGADLDPAVAAVIQRFKPQHANRSAWETNEQLARAMAFAYRPTDPRHAQTVASYIGLFLTWLAAHNGRDPQKPLDVEDLFTPGLIEAMLRDATWSNHSKASLRSLLRRILRNLDPSHVPAKLGNRTVPPPYSRAESDRFARLAYHQPSKVRTRDMCLIIGLGLGAGLDATDLRHLTRDSFTETYLDAQPILTVTVPGEGARARTVPVRRSYAPLVRRGLELHAATGKTATDLLIGHVADRNNVIGPVVGRSASAEQTETIELRMSRLRNTWLVAMMCAPLSLTDLLRAAGLGSARTVTDLLAHCPEPSPAAVEAAAAVLSDLQAAEAQS